jgi:hypothetical protein
MHVSDQLTAYSVWVAYSNKKLNFKLEHAGRLHPWKLEKRKENDKQGGKHARKKNSKLISNIFRQVALICSYYTVRWRVNRTMITHHRPRGPCRRPTATDAVAGQQVSAGIRTLDVRSFHRQQDRKHFGLSWQRVWGCLSSWIMSFMNW